MAGLDRKKTGSDQSSWDFYIAQNPGWLEKPLRTDIAGDLVGPDGKTTAYRFRKGEECQIINLELEKINGKEFAKVRINEIVGWTQPKFISKPTTIDQTANTGERYQERQETAFITAVNEAVAANGFMPITVAGVNRLKIEGVTYAEKNVGLNAYHKEKYADVIVTNRQGRHGISMKMERAPSLLGGGYNALYEMNPKFIKSVMLKALNAAIKDKDFELGSNKKLKDIYIQITDSDFLAQALTGNEKMGGPVHYMFTGRQDPQYRFEKGTLQFLDSTLYTTEWYQKKIPTFYFRVRRRNATQIFTNELDKEGLPIFFKNPNSAERARIVVDSKPTGRALVIKDK